MELNTLYLQFRAGGQINKSLPGDETSRTISKFGKIGGSTGRSAPNGIPRTSWSGNFINVLATVVLFARPTLGVPLALNSVAGLNEDFA
jgi:hypothetical protein